MRSCPNNASFKNEVVVGWEGGMMNAGCREEERKGGRFTKSVEIGKCTRRDLSEKGCRRSDRSGEAATNVWVGTT